MLKQTRKSAFMILGHLDQSERQAGERQLMPGQHKLICLRMGCKAARTVQPFAQRVSLFPDVAEHEAITDLFLPIRD